MTEKLFSLQYLITEILAPDIGNLHEMFKVWFVGETRSKTGWSAVFGLCQGANWFWFMLHVSRTKCWFCFYYNMSWMIGFPDLRTKRFIYCLDCKNGHSHLCCRSAPLTLQHSTLSRISICPESQFFADSFFHTISLGFQSVFKSLVQAFIIAW